jgi:hypothetical protein
MMRMRSYIEIHAARCFMLLDEVVLAHLERCGVNVFEKLWSSDLARVVQRVSYNIIFLYESFLEIFRKIREGGTGVSEIDVAASFWRRKDDCSKNRVGCPSWIER